MALGVICAIIIFTLCFSFSTILSGAEGEDHVTNYKYYKTVTVHSGDSVWSIASANFDDERYSSLNSYIGEINSINNLDSASTLNAGETIIVPYYSTEFR